MVTTPQIPEESNEPPEPHPHQDYYSSVPTAGGHTTSLHNGDPVGSSAIPTPPVLASKEAVQQVLDPEKSSNGPIASSEPIAFDYATTIDQSKFSPNGTITVVSEADSSEESPPFQGADAHWFAPLEVARHLGVNLEHGLPSQDAQARLARDGLNKLEGDEGVGVWRVLVRQVSNSLTLVS